MTIEIPVIAQVDVVVAGMSTGGVAAALAARAAGRQVMLFGYESYPGADVCAAARYWLEPDQEPRTELARTLFAGALQSGQPIRPMHIKYNLERAMLEAGAQWLYLSWPVCLLRDAQGRLAGLVIANRSGLQAIQAPVVIDTTDRALVGAMTPAAFRDFPSGTIQAERVTVIDENRWQQIPRGGVRLPGAFAIEGQSFTGHRHTLTLDMPDSSPQSWARADVQARLQTWHPGLIAGSERLFLLPPDRLDTGARLERWQGADTLAPASLRAGADAVFVLGPRADAADAALTELLKPCNLMTAGHRLGAEAAALATPLKGPVVPDYAASADETISVERRDHYFRFADGDKIAFDLDRFARLQTVDVLIAGGGTAGAPAGIAAGRAGASAIALDMLPGLGGVGTEGRIARYWFGNRCGFTAEIDQGVAGLAPDPDFQIAKGEWNSEWKKHWYLREAAAAGTQIWFGSAAVAAVMDGNRVCGALAATPYGTGVIRAGAVVDATGNADVAAAAGAQTVNISKAHVAVQGTGLPPVQPGKHYQNTDYTFVDDTDIMDMTRAFVLARRKFQTCFDIAQMVDSRQRQQVVGALSLDPLDFLAHRTFPDTVVTASSNFDSHGFTIHPVFMAKPPDKEPLYAHVPFRCLIPEGLEGILVTGLGVSAHRDALPLIRMQPDVQNQGYAAGYAATMLVRSGGGFRSLDIRTLQRHLVETGILEAAVLQHTDSFPLPASAVQEAVANGLDTSLGLAVIFGNPQASVPLLREAYAADDGTRQRRCAHLLGLLGDDTGIETLMAYVDAQPWDQGWHYTGLGQFGFSLSEIDSMLVALGRSGNRAVIPVLLRKAERLAGDAEFSHYRALTLAFENLPDPRAVAHFQRFLAAVKGGARRSLAEQLHTVPEDSADTTERNRELKELLLARGLYACGDPDGAATAVLQAYSQDLHGHYARHARHLLETHSPQQPVSS